MTDQIDRAERFDIVIVGGGFSGVMVAINVARRAVRKLRVAVIERRAECGRGIAYAVMPHAAILNVPAGAMGAFADQPGDFVRWLRERPGAAAEAVDPAAYYPRELYGAYVASLTDEARRAGGDITYLRGEVARVLRREAEWALVASDGRCIALGVQVVFALGASPPADRTGDFASVRDDPRYVRDPWEFLRRGDFPDAGAVLVVGSGLTALDTIVAFKNSGSGAALNVVSRGGRFPQPHGAPGGTPIDPFAAGEPATIRDIVQEVRAVVRRAGADGRDWREVIDGLRPRIPSLWLGLNAAERRRFLRHVRAAYDPYRHRAPAAVLAVKDALSAAGRLAVVAGRIAAVTPGADAIEVSVRDRIDGRLHRIAAAQIINCSGPGNTSVASGDPLIADLALQGAIVADPSGLGVAALPNGRLIDAHGDPARDLYTIGWPMRGVLFETTAVRELRVQARIVADELIASAPRTNS